MVEIFSITLPIFLIVALGYASIQFGWFAKTEIRPLGNFVLLFALPALIVRTFSQRAIGDVLNTNYLLAFALGSLASMLVGLTLARGVLKKPMAESAISAMGMSCGNSGYIGYPLALLVIGPIASVALALNMLVENLLMIPLALALAESAGGHGQALGPVMRGIAARLLRSPLIVSIALGMTLSFLELQLPAPLARTVDTLAMASGPVALFVIGATLHGLRLGGMVGSLSLIVLGKLLLHPLAVAAALLLFPVDDPALRTAAVLMAAVPMLGIYPLLGQRYGQEKLCSAAQLGATVLSFVTLSALLWTLKP